MTGFAASYATVCETPNGVRVATPSRPVPAAVWDSFQAMHSGSGAQPADAALALRSQLTTSDIVYMTLKNGTFVGNQATNGNGGAVMVTLEPGSATARDTFLTVDNITMRENVASGSAGGAFLGLSTELTASNIHAVGNVARGGNGGGMCVDFGGWVNMTASEFINNVAASGKGGGLAIVSSKRVANLADLIFTNNTSSGDGGGGGMFMHATPLSSSSVFFQGNAAEVSGLRKSGARRLLASVGADCPSMTRCGLQGDGGGFSAQDGSVVRIVNGTFFSNVATGRAGRGGGVSLANVTDVVIESTVMVSSRSPQHSFLSPSSRLPLGMGRVIVICILLLQVNNAAVDKAAAARLGVDAVMRYRAGDGGGFFAINPNPAGTSTVSLSNVTLTNNVALSAGGGVAAWGAIQLSVRDARVTGNAAMVNGGGVALGLGVRMAAAQSSFTANHGARCAHLPQPCFLGRCLYALWLRLRLLPRAAHCSSRFHAGSAPHGCARISFLLQPARTRWPASRSRPQWLF